MNLTLFNSSISVGTPSHGHWREFSEENLGRMPLSIDNLHVLHTQKQSIFEKASRFFVRLNQHPLSPVLKY